MKTVGSWLVILTIFGVFYYSADQTLASVEATVASSSTTNVLARRKPRNSLHGTGGILSGMQDQHILHDDAISIIEDETTSSHTDINIQQ